MEKQTLIAAATLESRELGVTCEQANSVNELSKALASAALTLSCTASNVKMYDDKIAAGDTSRETVKRRDELRNFLSRDQANVRRAKRALDHAVEILTTSMEIA